MAPIRLNKKTRWMLILGVVTGVFSAQWIRDFDFEHFGARKPSNIPSPSDSLLHEETVLVQPLSEIQAKKEGKVSFDRDIQRLNAMAPKFKENLPLGRVTGRMVEKKNAQSSVPKTHQR